MISDESLWRGDFPVIDPDIVDFIIDEFQLIESKSIGADVILLMASCLNNKEILKFYNYHLFA